MLLTLDNVSIHAPGGERLFHVRELAARQGDRIVLLGPNGVGKSQLMGLVRRAFAAPGSVAGIVASPSVVVGYFDQQMSHLPERETPYQFITGTFDLGDQRSLSVLAGAGVAVDRQHQPIVRLSPGEKARLGLLAIRLAEPNFYLMDEPTSHLDIAGQERLETEMLAHEATALLVTHDRSFAKSVGTRYCLIDRGTLRELDPSDPAQASLLDSCGAHSPR